VSDYVAAKLVGDAAAQMDKMFNVVNRKPNDYSANLVGPWMTPSDPYAVSGNPVERVGSRDAGVTAQSSIAARWPTLNNGRLVFDGVDDILFGTAKSTLLSQVVLPNIPNMQAGKGFTCTGLAKAPDGTWWVGSHGKMNELTASGETFYAGVVHLSADFSNILHDIRFSAIGLPNSSAQGVAIEPLSGGDYNVWGCICDGADTIYKISPTGTLRGSFTYSLPNGIAYDIARDKLIIIGTNGAVNWCDKVTGAITSSMTMRTITDSPDQLWYDQNGSLYVSGGPNIAGGLLIKYDVASKAARKCWVLDRARSIEGISIDPATGIVTVANDGYFHNSTDDRTTALNTIHTYQLDSLATPGIGTRLIITWGGKIAAQPAATKALVVGGYSSGPTVNTDYTVERGAGVFYTAVSNQIRFQVRIGGVDTAQVAWTVADVTAEANFALIYDASAGTAILYQNGVTLGTKVGLPVGTIPSMMWTVGALLDQTGSPANWGAFTLSSLMVAGA
jgi:hypothetical protein